MGDSFLNPGYGFGIVKEQTYSGQWIDRFQDDVLDERIKAFVVSNQAGTFKIEESNNISTTPVVVTTLLTESVSANVPYLSDVLLLSKRYYRFTLSNASTENAAVATVRFKKGENLGSLISSVEDMLETINDAIEELSPSVIFKGVATGGSDTTLEDNTKNFETDIFNNKICKITIDSIDYIRKISSSAGNSLGFTTLFAGLPASVTVGGGEDAWRITIACVLEGTEGNNYSVEFLAGTGVDAPMGAELDEETGILTITSSTNAASEPQPIMPGNVETLINTDEVLSLIFEVLNDYAAGVEIPVTTEPVPFTGGEDPISVESGMPYEILLG
jgi:hypothetical protein